MSHSEADEQGIEDRQPAATAPSMKLCTSCHDRMAADAILCRQCRSYQGGWWWARTLGLGLPWLIAAISLVSFAYTYHQSQLHNMFADASYVVKDVSKGSIQVIMSNVGPKPFFASEFAQLYCDPREDAEYRTSYGFTQQLPAITKESEIPANDARVIAYEVDGSGLRNYINSHHDSMCYLMVSSNDMEGFRISGIPSFLATRFARAFEGLGRPLRC